MRAMTVLQEAGCTYTYVVVSDIPQNKVDEETNVDAGAARSGALALGASRHLSGFPESLLFNSVSHRPRCVLAW